MERYDFRQTASKTSTWFDGLIIQHIVVKSGVATYELPILFHDIISIKY